MNKLTSRGLAATGALVAGLAGSVLTGATTTSASASAAPEWEPEHGIVIECTGNAQGLRVYTSVYENDPHGNTVQVVLGDPDDGNGASRNTDAKFLVDGVVNARVKVNGKRATIKGTAERYGARKKVYEEHEDAGYLIKVRGFHRKLDTDLVATYAGKTVPLTCSPAFYYDLEVKKIPIT
jgi:hypothetical protein